MRLRNYRRLFEPTTITFASGDKNVTIIRAENGSGKTGILMALLFGLFGTVKYDQFQIQNDDDVMVSSFLLKDGQKATCEVQIDFLDEDKQYTITRRITAQNISGHIKQDNSNVETTLLREGIKLDWNKEQIDSYMNNLIGENIRGFLFFDGVKYTDLFKQNNGRTQKELKSIIEKMLNINDLNEAIKTLNGMASDVSAASTSTKLDSKYSEALNKREEAKKAYDEAVKAYEEKSKKIEELEENYQKTLEKYSQYEQYQNVVEQIKAVDDKITSKKGEISVAASMIKQNAKYQLLYNVYSRLAPDVIEEFKEIGRDLSGGLDLIDSILNSGRCICCDKPLTESERDNWVKFKHQIESGEKYSYALVGRFKDDLSKIESTTEASDFVDYLNKVIEYLGELEELNGQKEELLGQLPQDGTDLSELTQDVINAKGEEKASEMFIKNAKLELDDLEKDRDKKYDAWQAAIAKAEEIEQEKALASGQAKKYEFYKKAANKLVALRNEYLTEAQKSISNRANEYFIKLISNSDRELVDRLVLDDDYSIKVFDKTGREIFGQLSAGQKLMASMAFVMGLTAEASDAKPTCNFPLVMDTPMSNLDSRNRGSLISLMPTVVKQWILTPMDTELTDTEITAFAKTGKVGKVYELHKKDIKSVIVPFDEIGDLYGGIKHE